MERVVRVLSVKEAEEVDLHEWMLLSADERMRIGEQMREEAFGPCEPRLLRILQIVKR